MPKPSKENFDQFLLDFDPRYRDPRFRHKPGRELPPHPLAVEMQILIHYKNPRALEDWVCKELAVRAAKEVRKKIAAIKNPKAKKLHPRLLELVEMAEYAGTPVPKKNLGRAESLLEYCNKELIVHAVDGIRISKENKFQIKGFHVFEVVQRYLDSIGIKMSAQTIEKNYKKWKWGAYTREHVAWEYRAIVMKSINAWERRPKRR